jgi:HSP20 family protein
MLFESYSSIAGHQTYQSTKQEVAMLFRYEPTVFDELISRTAPAEWVFPELFARFAVVDRTNDFPSINVEEDKDGVHIVAEVPGIPKEDVKLQIHDGTLTISGERKTPENAQNSEVLRREIRYGSFSRTIDLPESIDTEKVTADYANGVLRIALPKREAAKPKEISIR